MRMRACKRIREVFFATTAIAGLVLAGVAQAADFEPRKAPPRVVPLSWTGFYIGVHGGYGWGQWDGRLAYDEGNGPLPIWDSSTQSIDGNGWFAGGQIGLNYQVGAAVLGVEADVAWTNFKGDQTFTTQDFGNDGKKDYTWEIRNKLEVFGTVRGRLGFTATPTMLLYGTGGLAWGLAKGNLTVRCHEGQVCPASGLVTAIGSADETHIGWTAGAGAEWMPSGGNWTIKVEWLYVDLGNADYHLVGTAYPGTLNLPHTTDSFPADLKFHTVRAGLNYKF